MRAITPCLWFDNNAEEAVNFYTSVFKNSEIGQVSHYTEAGPGDPGSVLTIDFHINGQPFQALNGGPHFTFSPAVSFVVYCEDQAEIDEYWEKLAVGGEFEQCGWLRDKYGVSWQIVPTVLDQLMTGTVEQTTRVTQAIYKMKKLDIKQLQEAYEGR